MHELTVEPRLFGFESYKVTVAGCRTGMAMNIGCIYDRNECHANL